MTPTDRTRILWILMGAILLMPPLACSKSGGGTPSRYIVSFTTLPPDGTLVRAPFDVVVEITERKSGLPATFSPAVQFILEKSGGAGNLTGQVVVTMGSSPVTFPAVAYDFPDTLWLRCTSTATPAGAAPPVRFDVEIEVSPTDLGFVPPGDPIPPADFTLLDGLGNPFGISGRSLEWSLIETVTSGVVESGAVPFAGGDTVTVNASPVTLESDYVLTGNLQGSSNQASADLVVTSLILQDLPGPFVALKSARVGQTYQDDVSFAVAGATQWQLLSGTIPAGITLDPATGVLSGTPTAPANGDFTLYGKTGPALATPIRCALAVFSQDETEWVPGQSFVAPGPLASTMTTDSFTFVSSFDAVSYTTNIVVWHPPLAGVTSPLPLYVHHRGWGFNYQEYDTLLSRVAEYGFICASVEDYQSYFSPGSPAPDPFYNGSRIDAGMQNASAFHEGVIEHMLGRSQTPGDAFEGKIDETNVFVGGHSRGGGATHGSHTRGLEMKINGVIYFMPVDLRLYSWTIPPGTPPSYGIPDVQPRLPSLMIPAEQDGDTYYPVADQHIERVSGQATSMTVYGANHNYLADLHGADGNPYITRTEQHDIIVNLVVAFLKRWGELDLSLEGFLYGNEHKGSTEVGVASLRNMVESILIDDYQDPDPSLNLLGGSNSFTGGSRVEDSAYPPLPGFFLYTLGIQQNILTFTQTSATYSTGIPPGTDLTGRKRLIFRCGQTSLTGYDWVTFEVRLTDAAAQSATVTLFDRTAPSTAYLPDYQGGDPRVFDRVVEVQVLLTEFTAANPALNLNGLASVDLLFDFASVPGASEQIYLDDIRFE